MKQKLYITASEIGDYIYCPRGWWLRLNGFIVGSADKMMEGTHNHERVADSLRKNKILITISIILITFGLIAIIAVFSYQWIISSP